MPQIGRFLVLLFALSAACGGSSTEGLPTSFGDCASPPCEVALEAFTNDPDTIPYCPVNRESVVLDCPAAENAQTGTCENQWVVRRVYGFPGDFYECIYDVDDGSLVGARWAPDNHPTQVAGEPLRQGCELTDVCATE